MSKPAETEEGGGSGWVEVWLIPHLGEPYSGGGEGRVLGGERGHGPGQHAREQLSSLTTYDSMPPHTASRSVGECEKVVGSS